MKMIELLELIKLTGIIILPVCFFFIVYRVLIHIFESLSFSYKKAFPITFFLLASTFFPSIIFPGSENIFLFRIQSWNIGIHPTGFVLPVLISIILFVKNKPRWLFFFLSLIPVSFMAFLMTTPVLHKGIISPFPLWLFPSFMAAMIAVLNKERLGEQINANAFILSVFGIILGADIAHLPTLISLAPFSSVNAVFGGASGLDLIVLSGIFSVLFVNLFMQVDKLMQRSHLPSTS
jgi:hypothetical protein